MEMVCLACEERSEKWFRCRTSDPGKLSLSSLMAVPFSIRCDFK